MVFHVSWGDPGANYVSVDDRHEMDAALEAIAWKFDGPVMVFIDYEAVRPPSQLRVLVGHSDRSALRWSSFGSPVVRVVGAETTVPTWPVRIACDIEGIPDGLSPLQTQVTPAMVRRAVSTFVFTHGARPEIDGLVWREPGSGQR